MVVGRNPLSARAEAWFQAGPVPEPALGRSGIVFKISSGNWRRRTDQILQFIYDTCYDNALQQRMFILIAMSSLPLKIGPWE